MLCFQFLDKQSGSSHFVRIICFDRPNQLLRLIRSTLLFALPVEAADTSPTDTVLKWPAPEPPCAPRPSPFRIREHSLYVTHVRGIYNSRNYDTHPLAPIEHPIEKLYSPHIQADVCDSYGEMPRLYDTLSVHERRMTTTTTEKISTHKKYNFLRCVNRVVYV